MQERTKNFLTDIEIYDCDDFINVDASAPNGQVLHFTRDKTAMQWGMAQDDNLPARNTPRPPRA